ncbi:MAG: carbamoyl-phosphate synthase large subunit, partial [Flavobacteriales bacterium]
AEVFDMCAIDPWFVDQMLQIVEMEQELDAWNRTGGNLGSEDGIDIIRRAKRFGLSDVDIARVLCRPVSDVRRARTDAGIRPVYKQVDTCAAEFEAHTPYMYSTYEREPESLPPERTDQGRVMILGGGPNRIGQGIEFDYCAVHGVMALREAGYEALMVNCNPETVSTDYDLPDRLYFEPLTYEDVMEIVEREKPDGVILQFGGQTPLKLALPLMRAGVKILGTHPDIIDQMEDRKRFNTLMDELGIQQPEGGTATTLDEAVPLARGIGYPLLVRPSYVLGGRGMRIVYSEEELVKFFASSAKAGEGGNVLLDRFLSDAVEVDVDCIGDGTEYVIGGVMEHIEEAGVHSGDSACSLPPYSLSPEILDLINAQTVSIAARLGIVGLMNIQWAVQGTEVYILEVNPRASRTVPFVSKTIGHPLAKYAARVMVGERLRDIGFVEQVIPKHFAVKESILPFTKFPGVDTLLGPEMRSTGEVMGIDRSFERAFLKSQAAASNALPDSGQVFISVRNEDKDTVVAIARTLSSIGFEIVATRGTALHLEKAGVAVSQVNKVKEGRPHIVDALINHEIKMVINTTSGARSIEDSRSIRRATLNIGVPYFTTIAGARAATGAMDARHHDDVRSVSSLQEFHPTPR